MEGQVLRRPLVLFCPHCHAALADELTGLDGVKGKVQAPWSLTVILLWAGTNHLPQQLLWVLQPCMSFRLQTRAFCSNLALKKAPQCFICQVGESSTGCWCFYYRGWEGRQVRVLFDTSSRSEG